MSRKETTIKRVVRTQLPAVGMEVRDGGVCGGGSSQHEVVRLRKSCSGRHAPWEEKDHYWHSRGLAFA